MADNVTADPGAGGATFRTDDDGTAHWPYTKLAWGADNTQTIVAAGASAIPIQDGGNSITVDGTVAATQSGTWTVTGAGGSFPVTDSGGSLTVDGTVAVTNGGTFAVQVDGSALTSLQLIDDVIFADDAAFTAATSKVVAVGGIVTSDSVDSGDVGAFAMLANRQQKVTLYDSSGVELSVGGGTQYTEDAAATANPVGNAIIVVRDDARGGSLTTTDGDNVALRGNNNGELYVKHTDSIAVTNSGLTELAAAINGSSQLDINIAASAATLTVASHAVTNAGTFAVQVDGNALTALQLIDDVVKTDDAAFTAASDKVTVIGGIVTADSVDSGDAGALAMLTNRQLKVTLFDSGGSELSVGGGTQYTEDAAAAANPVGNALIVVRDDARGGSLTTTDGDNVALRGNNNGELYVKHTDTIAATQSGTWNVTNVSGTVSLPTGAATAANQSTVITSLQLIDDVVFAEDVAAQAADKGVAILAVRRDADTSLVGTDNDYANLQVDANGYLKVEIFDGGGSHTVDNAGTFAVQVDGSALTALQLIDDPVITDDTAFTPATSKVMMAGFEADEGSTDSVDEGDAGAARMTLDRKVIVTPQPHTAGGLSIFRSLDLDESEEDVKTSAGQVYAMWVTNTATSTRFIKFYNATAANVTVGSTTPVITIGIPGNSTDDIAGNFGPGGMGIAFDTAICVAATTGVADNDTGAPGANEVVVNIFYK